MMKPSQAIIWISISLIVARIFATALTPTENTSLSKAGFILEEVVPTSIKGWKLDPTMNIIQPNEGGSLRDKVYDQTISRGYRDKNGYLIMLVIAYGRNQSDTLQLHRPEVCYVANGFKIISNERRDIKLDVYGTVSLPSRGLYTRSSFRPEVVSYWTRVGDTLPTSNLSRQYEKLKFGLSGRIPDGLLVRVSSISDKPHEAFKMHDMFINDLLEVINPEDINLFLGQVSKEFLSVSGGDDQK